MTDENEEKKTTKNRFPDRFSVEPKNLEKIGRLLSQLRSALQGCDATRKDMLNWIVERMPEQLNPSDLKELAERFYDEERFLKLAIEEIRAAKVRGERLTLEEILKRKTEGVAPTPRRQRKQKPVLNPGDEQAPRVEGSTEKEKS